jgi:hypothetical protein
MKLDPERQRLVDRILKLLALANSTTFAGEADNARRMAEQLIEAHNVTLGPGKPAQDAIERRLYRPFAVGMRWEAIIADALSDLCSCLMLFRDALDEFTLVGSVMNLDALEYMLREVNRQRIAAWLQYKASQGPDSFHKFCYGFAMALRDKIVLIIDQRTLDKAQHAARTWYLANVGPIGKGSSLAMGRASSQAGEAAGKGASLHRGAVGTPQKLIGRT